MQGSNVAHLLGRGLFLALILMVAIPSLTAQRRLPDLIVSNATIQKVPGISVGQSKVEYVKSITVTVTNACGAPSPSSYVLVTFKKDNSPDAKPLFFIGNTVKPLKAGESFSQTFDIPARKIAVGEFIYLEADPYKKVAEIDETNNWRTLFPTAAGKAASCTPFQ